MKSKFNRALSLLEVLITVAILATAITLVLCSFTTCLSSVKLSQDITLACFLTEEKIAEIEQRYKAGLDLPTSGKQTLQNKEFSWEYKLAQADTPGLAELNFKVSWPESAREKPYQIEFLTYLFKP